MPNLVFISYAKEDQRFAERLYLDLKQAGVSLWMDTHDLLPGQPWEREIEEAISRSSYFIALQSTRSVGKRGHVQKELRRALEVADRYPEDELFLIPVRVEECEPTFRAIRKLHRLDLFPDYAEGLSKLLRVVGYAKAQLTYVENYPRVGYLTRLTDRGFGFIHSELGDKDLFFHHGELDGVTFEELREGDPITFLLGSGIHGLVATRVQRL
jgi:cold shock CspA family protein